MKTISCALVLLTVFNSIASAQDTCSICPFDQVVTLPNAIVPKGTGGDFISSGLTCAETEALAQAGEFSPGECAALRVSSGVAAHCGCSDAATTSRTLTTTPAAPGEEPESSDSVTATQFAPQECANWLFFFVNLFLGWALGIMNIDLCP